MINRKIYFHVAKLINYGINVMYEAVLHLDSVQVLFSSNSVSAVNSILLLNINSVIFLIERTLHSYVVAKML